MTHVINKMRQLGRGLADFMALFRAWLKFSSVTVNLFGWRLGQKNPTTHNWNGAKQTYNKPHSDGNWVLPLWVVLLSWLHFTGVNGLRESLGSGRRDIKLWEWRLTMKDSKKKRERRYQHHHSPSADMASNKKKTEEKLLHGHVNHVRSI